MNMEESARPQDCGLQDIYLGVLVLKDAQLTKDTY